MDLNGVEETRYTAGVKEIPSLISGLFLSQGG